MRKRQVGSGTGLAAQQELCYTTGTLDSSRLGQSAERLHRRRGTSSHDVVHCCLSGSGRDLHRRVVNDERVLEQFGRGGTKGIVKLECLVQEIDGVRRNVGW